MNRKPIIMIGLFIGSTVGGYIPALWGADFFSLSGIIGTMIGGILGVWLGFRMSE